MSERTYSQRMADNNDGMDPDWRPPSKPAKETLGLKIDRILLAAQRFDEIPFKEEDFKEHDMVKLTIPVRYLRELKKALGDL